MRSGLAVKTEGSRTALTARALVLGSLIGAVMCLSNLYVGLKTGLAFPVALIACIVGLGAYRALAPLWPSRSRYGLSLLETGAMQSAASSAGYSTGATLVSAGVGWLPLARDGLKLFPAPLAPALNPRALGAGALVGLPVGVLVPWLFAASCPPRSPWGSSPGTAW